MPEAMLIKAGYKKVKILDEKRDEWERLTELTFIDESKHPCCKHKARVEYINDVRHLCVEEFT